MQRVLPAILLVFALAVIGSFPMTWSTFMIDGDVVSQQTGLEMMQGKVDVVQEDSLIKDGAAQEFTVLWGVLIAALISIFGAISLYVRPLRRFGYMTLPGGGFIIVAVLGATLVTGFPFENGVEVLSGQLERAVVNSPDWAKAEAKAMIDSMGTGRGLGFWIALSSGAVIAVVGWFFTHRLKVSDAVASLDGKGPITIRDAKPGKGGGSKDVRHKYLKGDDASGDWEYVDDDEEEDDDEYEYVYEDEDEDSRG